MQSEHNILLAYLRSKPRHGQDASSNMFGNDDETTYVNQLKIISSAIGTATEYIKQYNEIVKKLDQETSIANRSLSISVGLYETYRNQIVKTIEKSTWLEQRNKSLNKALNLNSDAATLFADKMRNLNMAFGDDKLFKFAANIDKLTGGFIKAIKSSDKKDIDATLRKQAKFQSYITENLQLSEETANSYALYSAGVGKSADEAIVQQNELAKILGDKAGIDQLTAQTLITEDIAAMSSDIRQQYGAIPGQLEAATLKSRLLGVSMAKLYDIGKSTLDIESAVGNEIEMQLLSGRKLLTQNSKGNTVNFMAAYRKATLTNDALEQQTLLQNMLQREGETLKTNFMYREKMAQSLGMSGDELMKSIERAELMQGLGLQQLADLSYDDLKAQIAELKKSDKFEGKEDDLDALLKASDKRTLSEQYLDNIDANISKLITSRTFEETFDEDGNKTGRKLKKEFEFGPNSDAAKNAKGFSDVLVKLADQFTQKSFSDAIANLQKTGLALDSVFKPIEEFLPDSLAKLKDQMTQYATLGTSGITINGDVNIGPTTVGNTTTATSNRDAILFDPKDQIVTVASTDRGQLENTVNNMMSGTTNNINNITNAANIDYNAMASAIALAMSRVKLSIGPDYTRDTFLNT